MVVLKRELHHAAKLKSEASAVKAEHHVKKEIKSELIQTKNETVKAELQRQQRQRGGIKSEGSGVDALLQRGLELRAKAEEAKKVKQEVGRRKVKKEHPGKKSGRKAPGKRRVTAAKRNASREVMNRPVALSEELADVLGSPALSRPEAVSRLWAYGRDNGLLNPENKREILCDETLQKLLGQSRAGLFQLQHLLMPHFDYSVKAEAESQPGRPAVKRQQEADSKSTVKAAPKEEQKFKDELKLEPKVKCVKQEHAAVKSEGIGSSLDMEAVLRSLALRVVGFSRDFVGIEFLMPPGLPTGLLEAVALPTSSSEASSSVVRVPCTVEFRESADGGLEAWAEARFEGLEPATEYRVAVQVPGTEALSSCDIVLPQRAKPEKWAPRDAQLWCSSLRVPELTRKVAEYSVDGATLLSFEEEDLRGLGIGTPFLLRRILAGLKELRGS